MSDGQLPPESPQDPVNAHLQNSENVPPAAEPGLSPVGASAPDQFPASPDDTHIDLPTGGQYPDDMFGAPAAEEAPIALPEDASAGGLADVALSYGDGTEIPLPPPAEPQPLTEFAAGPPPSPPAAAAGGDMFSVGDLIEDEPTNDGAPAETGGDMFSVGDLMDDRPADLATPAPLPAPPGGDMFSVDDLVVDDAGVNEAGPAPLQSPAPLATPEPLAMSPEPLAMSPEPLAMSPEPLAMSPEPLAMSPEPLAMSPEPLAMPEPLATPEDFAAPEPLAMPEPLATPEPVEAFEPLATPEPLVTPDAFTSPEPLAAPADAVPAEPLATPEPLMAPEPVEAFEPLATPEPLAMPEPLATPDAFTSPEPLVTPEAEAAPEPFVTSEPVAQSSDDFQAPHGITDSQAETPASDFAFNDLTPVAPEAAAPDADADQPIEVLHEEPDVINPYAQAADEAGVVDPAAAFGPLAGIEDADPAEPTKIVNPYAAVSNEAQVIDPAMALSDVEPTIPEAEPEVFMRSDPAEYTDPAELQPEPNTAQTEQDYFASPMPDAGYGAVSDAPLPQTGRTQSVAPPGMGETAVGGLVVIGSSGKVKTKAKPSKGAAKTKGSKKGSAKLSLGRRKKQEVEQDGDAFGTPPVAAAAPVAAAIPGAPPAAGQPYPAPDQTYAPPAGYAPPPAVPMTPDAYVPVAPQQPAPLVAQPEAGKKSKRGRKAKAPKAPKAAKPPKQGKSIADVVFGAAKPGERRSLFGFKFGQPGAIPGQENLVQQPEQPLVQQQAPLPAGAEPYAPQPVMAPPEASQPQPVAQAQAPAPVDQIPAAQIPIEQLPAEPVPQAIGAQVIQSVEAEAHAVKKSKRARKAKAPKAPKAAKPPKQGKSIADVVFGAAKPGERRSLFGFKFGQPGVIPGQEYAQQNLMQQPAVPQAPEQAAFADVTHAEPYAPPTPQPAPDAAVFAPPPISQPAPQQATAESFSAPPAPPVAPATAPDAVAAPPVAPQQPAADFAAMQIAASAAPQAAPDFSLEPPALAFPEPPTTPVVQAQPETPEMIVPDPVAAPQPAPPDVIAPPMPPAAQAAPSLQNPFAGAALPAPPPPPVAEPAAPVMPPTIAAVSAAPNGFAADAGIGSAAVAAAAPQYAEQPIAPPVAMGAPAPVAVPDAQAAPVYKLSSWGRRAGAAVIDGLIMGVVFYAIVTFGGLSGMLPTVAVGLLLLTVYGAGSLTYNNGQTFGKRALGIRVVREDGKPIDIGWAISRETLAKPLLSITVVDELWPLKDEQKRAIHDMAVKSRVVDAG